MAYISSNNNRWYCQLEQSYGDVQPITAANRIPAVQMSVQQSLETPTRRDKTGTRTYAGAPQNLRKQTNYALTTYMTSLTTAGTAPAYGPLFQAALGADPLVFNGGTIAANSTTSIINFAASHGLRVGQAITMNGELRFVVSVISPTSVLLNAPFTTMPATGGSIGGSVSYTPATDLPSFSLFDYWSPDTSVQRLLCGCAVDQLTVQVDSDYQEFRFKGVAQDVLDSASFLPNQGGLPTFPTEPTPGAAPTTVVPGHLGQAWLGPVASRFLTVTGATVTLTNQLDTRTREFGSTVPQAISPGMRKVVMNLDLYGQDDNATIALYQAARQRSAITAGFQLGQTSGQLFGFYMKSIVPEVPQYDDKDSRLQWRFQGSQAQGQGDDEIWLAFG